MTVSQDKMLVLSPLFEVKKTPYGGRGCYALAPIAKGSEVLCCKAPLSSSILRSFKKEVCSWCFHYENGSNLKHRAPGVPNNFYFCSAQCADSFVRWDELAVYRSCIDSVEEQYLRVQKKKPTSNVDSLADSLAVTAELVECSWLEVNRWEERLPQKPTKRMNLIPYVDENELLEIKYAVGVLYEMYKRHLKQQDPTGEDSDPEAHPQDENFLSFDLLQSDELLKLQKYPALVESYTRVYQFMRLTVAAELQPLLCTATFRDIIGKNLSNAFGIWSLDAGDKEFFGYSVYPTASYFNHSCCPNLVKTRKGRSLHFTTMEDIPAGAEMYICYGNSGEEDQTVRQKELDEWHFQCQCGKCLSEAQ